MRQTIETNQKFALRMEDFIYLFLNIYLIPVGGFIFLFTRSTDITLIFIILGTVGISTSTILILWSYKKRLQNHYYIEDETIIKERNGKEIFRIPFKEIVSVRVSNKRGNQGSIIFFTEQRSKHFEFSAWHTPVVTYNTPLAAFGFTEKKIDLIKNRKQLLTAVYRVNPELHFIN